MSENQNEEIERKFLLKKGLSISFFNKLKDDSLKVDEIEQFYMSGKPTVHRFRIVNGIDAIECYKGQKTENGLSCVEKEYPVELEKALDLKSLAMTSSLYKTRYTLMDSESNKKLEFDIYKNELEGLSVLEVEFKTEKDALNYKLPEWLNSFILKEVTKDYEYSNFNLAKNSVIPEVLDNKARRKIKNN